MKIRKKNKEVREHFYWNSAASHIWREDTKMQMLCFISQIKMLNITCLAEFEAMWRKLCKFHPHSHLTQNAKIELAQCEN